jgi:hypothetical protein
LEQENALLKQAQVIQADKLKLVSTHLLSLFELTFDFDKQITSLSRELQERVEGAMCAKDMTQLKSIFAHQAFLEKLGETVKYINSNQDLQHFFNALFTELVANFIAALNIYSGKVVEDKSTSFGDAANFFDSVIELAPVVGQLVSNLLPQFASCFDIVENIKSKECFLRILDVTASSISEFEQVATIVAAELTMTHKERLMSLQGLDVPSDWKSRLGSILAAVPKGIEGTIIEFMARNETQAKLLGRNKAHEIIAYLGQEGVSEKLSMEHAVGDGTSDYQSKPQQTARVLLAQFDKTTTAISVTSSSHARI